MSRASRTPRTCSRPFATRTPGGRKAWRLPMHGGFATFDRIIESRSWRGTRDTSPRRARRLPEAPRGAPLALSSFGGYGVERLRSHSGWTASTAGLSSCHRASRGSRPLPGRRRVRRTSATSTAGACATRISSRAVDVVVTKPGYGIISECIANDTAMLYTSRGRFVEYDVMVAEMPRFLRCELPRSGCAARRPLADALERLLETTSPTGTATHGRRRGRRGSDRGPALFAQVLRASASDCVPQHAGCRQIKQETRRTGGPLLWKTGARTAAWGGRTRYAR